MSEAYTRARHEIAARASDKSAMAARLRFFLPRDLPKIWKPLAELEAAGALPKNRTWRILDLGAGLGATSLGVASFARARDLADRFDVLAIDRHVASLRIFDALAATVDRAEIGEISLKTGSLDVTKGGLGALGGPFDLVVMGFALNEMFADAADSDEAASKKADLLARLASLAPQGSVIVLEPALRETSRALHRVRDLLAARGKAPFVFAPCLRSGPCPALIDARDWCHEELPFALPEALIPVARQAGLRVEGLAFSYVTLRSDDLRLHRALRGARQGAQDAPGRVSLRVVSDPMPSKGKHELFACGEEGRVRLMRLGREASPENEAFASVSRGDLIELGTRDERGRIARNTGVTSRAVLLRIDR